MANSIVGTWVFNDTFPSFESNGRLFISYANTYEAESFGTLALADGTVTNLGNAVANSDTGRYFGIIVQCSPQTSPLVQVGRTNNTKINYDANMSLKGAVLTINRPVLYDEGALEWLKANAKKQGEEPEEPEDTSKTRIIYKGKVVEAIEAGKTGTIKCAGALMRNDIVVKVGDGSNLPDYDGSVEIEGEEIPVVFKLQEKSTDKNGDVLPDSGFDGLSKVNVNVKPILQAKTTDKNGDVFPDTGYDGLSKVTVNVPIPSGYIKPSGGLEVNSNGTYNVSDKATVTVNVDIPEPPASYDGKVTITKKVNLDPELNHYGVIPEGCMLDVGNINGEETIYNPGDPFPASEVIYDAPWCVYNDNGRAYGYDDSNGVIEKTGWYYSYTEMGSEISETRILESIGGIPIVAILGLGDSFFSGANFHSLVIPKSVTYITLVATDGFSAIEYPNLTAITYLGTTAEWNSITFGEDWNSGCPEITVTCTDGTITIPAYGS